MNIFLRKICLPVFIFSICINIAAASSTVTEYTYTPDKIYTVRSSLGIVTQIEISPKKILKILERVIVMVGIWLEEKTRSI
jgi:virB9 protein